ncbi:MAG: cytochrome P450 [Alphaproteobacteria bacterium]
MNRAATPPLAAAAPAWSAEPSGFDINELDRRFLENPFPTYRRLRDESPVHRNPDGTFLVTRYADVLTVLRDKRMSNDKTVTFMRTLGNTPVYEHHTHTMVFRDPPDHTRLRRLVSHAFTPKALAAMAPLIDRAVDQLLEENMRGGKMDMIGNFTYLLPLAVITYLMGVPTDQRDQFRRWSSAITASLEPKPSAETIATASTAVEEFKAYLADLADRRRKEPGDDLISLLVQAEEDGDRLTGLDLLHNAAFLLNAGHETTTNLVGNGMHAFFRFPDQLTRLRARPDLLEDAVEEMLRFDSPNQIGGRSPTEDFAFGDTVVPKGTFIWIANGAANHDDRVFDHPDRFDIARAPNKHVAFGHGIHLCLGASLARMEAKAAVHALVTRFPTLHPAGAPVRRLRARHRGFSSYPVAV